MEPEILISIHVSGRVQGVGFRYSARSMAQGLGLKGIVKNLPDKSVYIEVEGNKKSLDDFISWCKKGPEYAKVSEVRWFIGEKKGYTVFEIIS